MGEDTASLQKAKVPANTAAYYVFDFPWGKNTYREVRILKKWMIGIVLHKTIISNRWRAAA
jgi:hypothetical protein